MLLGTMLRTWSSRVSALAGLLLGLSSSTRVAQEDAPRYGLEVAEGAALELRVNWAPYKKSLCGLFEQTPALRAPVPARERESYGGAAFRALLPREPVALGEVWKVEDGATLGFLRQFHAGAKLKSSEKGEVAGTYACLRAVSEDAVEVLLRTHAVFEFDDGMVFKPAQYEGRLLLGRADGALRAFHLELPSRDPNADVIRRATARRITKSDIGWVPRMELTSGAVPAVAWQQQVPDEEARLALRRSFYAFAKLDWLPFDEAVLRARETRKPLHLVVLVGALDDDSC